MKISIYSDVHLEFKSDFRPPADLDSDLMILAGDIINLNDFAPLKEFLKDWNKPVLYVNGNHEYYTQRPMDEEDAGFRTWIAENKPNLTLLLDEEISLQGVNFFGGTMWTDFAKGDPRAMDAARRGMMDYDVIRNSGYRRFDPMDTIELHNAFKEKLIAWFEKQMHGPRVVITHHAPVINPHTRYRKSGLMPAFNSLDMIEIIEKYQPDLWVYGHTHECDNQTLGKTKIISNQLGYPTRWPGEDLDRYECEGFDKAGAQVTL
jgi:predicted phosphodiesterase